MHDEPNGRSNPAGHLHAATRDVAAEYGRGTLLTPGEVAAIFRVSPQTVARWGESGLLTTLRTPGGHRRYPATEVESLLANGRAAN
jgi:excisionase family DNA binding protein